MDFSNKIRQLYHNSRYTLLYQKYKYVDNFIFVHIHKTGGTSVERALMIPNLHDRALTQRKWMGRCEYERRFSFSIVRNPWDLAVSLYHYLVQSGQISDEQMPEFTEWVQLTFGQEDTRFSTIPGPPRTQRWWLEDEEGELMVDFVAQLETIEDDWEHICKVIGCNVSLPHTNRTNRSEYIEYYDKRARDTIGKFYEDDINQFGYSFK